MLEALFGIWAVAITIQIFFIGIGLLVLLIVYTINRQRKASSSNTQFCSQILGKPIINQPTVFNKNTNSPTKQTNNTPEIIVPERQEPEPEFLSSCKDIPPQTGYIAYFKNGKLYNVEPRNKNISLNEDKQTAYHARYHKIRFRRC